MGASQINMAVSAKFRRRLTNYGREWEGTRSINKAVGAEFTKRRTACGREGVEI
jgi:hypothetical protein